MAITISTVRIRCCLCNTEFDKPAKEYNRILRRKNKAFCSPECGFLGQRRPGSVPPAETLQSMTSIGGMRGNWADGFSPFRMHLICAKRRSIKSGIECDLTLPGLLELWGSQKGVCPLTGWIMDNPGTTTSYSRFSQPRKRHPRRASLDRIDNSKGYVCGNVRFICLIANLAKSTFSDEELIEFCRAVSEIKLPAMPPSVAS